MMQLALLAPRREAEHTRFGKAVISLGRRWVSAELRKGHSIRSTSPPVWCPRVWRILRAAHNYSGSCMKVDSKTLYAGVPIVEVRDTLRRYRGSFFSVDFFARAMKISTTRAAGVRKQLLADGYLKATKKSKRPPRPIRPCTSNAYG